MENKEYILCSAIWYKDLPLEEIDKLLSNKYHECRLAALMILVYQYKKSEEKTKKIRIRPERAKPYRPVTRGHADRRRMDQSRYSASARTRSTG